MAENKSAEAKQSKLVAATGKRLFKLIDQLDSAIARGQGSDIGDALDEARELAQALAGQKPRRRRWLTIEWLGGYR
jgi:hypothetical protein